MNRIEHILTCVAEESNEVGQRACKASRFGLQEVQPGQAIPLDNWQRMVDEFHDLYSVLIMLAEDSGRNRSDIAQCSAIPSVVIVETPERGGNITLFDSNVTANLPQGEN